MDDAERLEMLRLLHGGCLSRNRSYERFENPETRRVLRGYRRLRSLLREISQPEVRAGARWSGNPDTLAVAVDVPWICYRRIVFLSAWEAEFFLSEAGDSISVTAPVRPSIP